MARIFIDTEDLESAVAVREAVQADGHEIEMVESRSELESRSRGDEDEIALVLTGDPERRAARAMAAWISERIPRPPLVAVVRDLESDERQALADRLELDDCLAGPPSGEEVLTVLDHQLDRFELQLETGIVGRTEIMREVLERIQLIGPVRSTVLLTGESGTGKELAARAIHGLSPRRNSAFIPVNCAALPESLLESELFGHEKGAFTGATSRRKGMFELADGGTLLLDEISEMPPPLQTRLLRVLENRRFMRVGGETEIEVNVRVLAATNRDLREAVQTGEFRRDLYYRLNVLHVELPPLRKRKADIPVLVRRFVKEFSESHETDFKGIAPETMEILLDYSWPGNVRELRNLVESMVVLAPGSVIRPDDVPPEIRSGRGRSMLPARREDSTAPLVAAGEGPPEAGAEGSAAGSGRPPELDFVFRTLVDLKMDVEDLRQEFDRFREQHPELAAGEGHERRGTEIEIPVLEEMIEEGRSARARDADGDGEPDGAGERGGVPPAAEGPAEAGGEEERTVPGTAYEPEVDEEGEQPQEPEDDGPLITFEPGMSMKELEREAIVATLQEVDGNRRKAAEKLEIGERTLYRKLKEYDIDL